MTAAVVIALLTIAGLVFFSRRVPEWLWAAGGATAVVVFGIDSYARAWNAISAQWDVLLFFAGLTLATAVAEEVGVFSWVMWRAALWGAGSSRRLYAATLAVAALTTIFLTNDAAVIIVAPLVAVLVLKLRLPPVPFILSVAFIANAASAVLPISNPTNFIIAHAAGMNLLSYVRAVEFPALAAFGMAIATLVLLFHRPRKETYSADLLEPVRAPKARFVGVISLMALSMIVASALSFPVGVSAMAGALALLALLLFSQPQAVRSTIARSQISIVVLVASLFVLVDGLRNTGVLALAARWFSGLGAGPSALLTALLSNVFNNLPIAIVVTQMLQHDPSQVAAAKLAAGSIIGLAIGPNLTTVGSLSTILLLAMLRSRGIVIRFKDFFVPGLAVTGATLLIALLAFRL